MFECVCVCCVDSIFDPIPFLTLARLLIHLRSLLALWKLQNIRICSYNSFEIRIIYISHYSFCLSLHPCHLSVISILWFLPHTSRTNLFGFFGDGFVLCFFWGPPTSKDNNCLFAVKIVVNTQCKGIVYACTNTRTHSYLSFTRRMFTFCILHQETKWTPESIARWLFPIRSFPYPLSFPFILDMCPCVCG